MTVTIIVQARMGSTRFPGKIMAPFLPLFAGGPRVTVLEHVLRRCKKVGNAGSVILATPDSADHADAWALSEGLGCDVFAGNEHDVLERYYRAAEWYMRDGADDHIVRVTADCPLIDPNVIQELIALHLGQGTDYACNVMPRTYPKGYDCEIMTFEALEAAWVSAKRPYDREHVTPWLQRMDGIKRANLQQKINRSEVNLCIDYPEDPARIEELLKILKLGREELQ